MCKVFDQGFFEAFSYTPWQAIPLAWGPQTAYIAYLGFQYGNPLWLDICLLVLGFFSWTFAEYVLHRFLFHAEDYWLPGNRRAMALHWTFHGIHHTFPQEKYRLVFPIAPGLLIMYGFIYWPISLIYPEEWHYQVYAGLLVGYMAYDLLHYFFHHSSPQAGWVKDLKAYHMQHHYRNGQVKFGVSNKFWDKIFFTTGAA